MLETKEEKGVIYLEEKEEWLTSFRVGWTRLWNLEFISPESRILFLSGFYFLRILVRSAQPSQIGAKKENQRSAWATGIYAAH